MASLSDLFLDQIGAAGAYNPFFNSTFLPDPPTREGTISSLYDQMEQGNWVTNRHMWNPEHREAIIKRAESDFRDTKAHENEHKRQFNLPGSYFSKEDRAVWRGSPHWKEKKNSGYSDLDVPIEILAGMVGGSSGETGSEGNWPPYNWNKLSDEQKLWILKNREGHLTDQTYLEKPTNTSALQRAKHLGRGLVGKLQSLFE